MVAAMNDLSFATKQIRSSVLAFDTNNLLLFLVRNESPPLWL